MKRKQWNEMDTTSKGIAIVASIGLAYSVGTYLYEVGRRLVKKESKKDK